MSIEPITRLQRFLRVLADSSADMPEPLRNLEKCCCYACGHLDTRPELHTTLEKLIASVRDKSIVPPKPNTRLEKYVAAMAGVWDDELPEPITREDKILFEAASGEDVTLSGNPLILENCIGGKALKALHVYGKSTQDGTPTPDAPVPIVSAGDGGSVAVKVTGKNLLDFLHVPITQNGWQGTFTRVDNTLTVYAINGWIALWFDNPVPGKQISVSLTYRQIDEKTGDKFGAFAIGTSDKIIYPDLPQYIVKTDSPTMEWTRITGSKVSGQYIFLSLKVSKEGVGEERTIEIKDFQLELGTTATTYSPYHEQLLTLHTPNGLPGVPVTSGGNYTDPQGQQWVCDEVDLEREVRVQRVKVKELSPDDKWAYQKLASGNNNFQTRVYGEDASKNSFPSICNILPFKNVTWNDNIQNLPKIYANNQEITVSFPPSSEYSSLEAFKQLLTNVKSFIFYCLATPVETPLTPAEIAAYKSLTTYEPTTGLQATDGAGLEATYKCNVRKAEKTINDLYAKLTAELEA